MLDCNFKCWKFNDCQKCFCPLFVAILLVFTRLCAFTQQTVGLLSYDPALASPGYNLIYPNNQSSVFLLDMCGRIVHEWTDHPDARPGTVARLGKDGFLYRAKLDLGIQTEPSFGAGGSGGTIEQIDWDNTVVWRHVIADSLRRAHHDLHLMPNGHILAIVWEKKDRNEIVRMGFDTIQFDHRELWSEAVYEIDPVLDSVVWSWHAWDHLVQDFDPAGPHYGVISEACERININYHQYPSSSISDWLHINSVDYSPLLDQITLSVRNFNEVWIIDHSTTRGEAAGSTGGNFGKGGDLLYRWGNPQAYDAGTEDDRIFWQQHDVQWILDPALQGTELYGQICLFNNYVNQENSYGQVLFPAIDTLSKTYLKDTSGTFLPGQVEKSFSHPDQDLALSPIASSIQFLSNGNALICAARNGFLYELSQFGEVLWEYRTPLIFGNRVSQGTEIQSSQNFTNQVRRYPNDFEGFAGKDLTPGEYLELDPDPDFCQTTPVARKHGRAGIRVFPNPAGDFLVVDAGRQFSGVYTLCDFRGRRVVNGEIVFDAGKQQKIDISRLPAGLYVLKIGLFSTKVLIH